MKIQYTFYYIIIWVCTLSLYSCEDFIEIDLPANQINREDVFEDVATAKAALSALYANQRNSSLFAGSFQGMGTLMDLYTDQLDCFHSDIGGLGVVSFFKNSLMSSDGLLKTIWNQNYNCIYGINAFIEGLEASSGIGEDDKKIFLGEAYLLRALYYQYLTQLFGDVPYTTTTDYNYNSKISKTNQLDVLVKVEADLKLALELLPTDYRHSERIYPNQAVAELLLAKNYLLQKQYDKAALFSKKVLDNSFYRLEQDLEKVFKKTAQSTLWQLKPNEEAISTLEAGTFIFISGPPADYALSSDLIEAFEQNDLRKIIWIKEVEGNGTKWYHAYKYQNNTNRNTNEYSIVFRIEEAYFIHAEALAGLGKIDEGIFYLNQIKERAQVSLLPLGLSREAFVQELLKEARLEFFTEHGHRFFDLKRNNQLVKLKSKKPNWELYHTSLPYPESEILLNPNLLPQNEGY